MTMVCFIVNEELQPRAQKLQHIDNQHNYNLRSLSSTISMNHGPYSKPVINNEIPDTWKLNDNDKINVILTLSCSDSLGAILLLSFKLLLMDSMLLVCLPMASSTTSTCNLWPHTPRWINQDCLKYSHNGSLIEPHFFCSSLENVAKCAAVGILCKVRISRRNARRCCAYAAWSSTFRLIIGDITFMAWRHMWT